MKIRSTITNFFLPFRHCQVHVSKHSRLEAFRLTVTFWWVFDAKAFMKYTGKHAANGQFITEIKTSLNFSYIFFTFIASIYVSLEAIKLRISKNQTWIGISCIRFSAKFNCSISTFWLEFVHKLITIFIIKMWKKT